jgi:hypothetical protein
MMAILEVVLLSWLLGVIGQHSVPSFRNQGQNPPMLDESSGWSDLEGFLERHALPENVTSEGLDARNHVQILTNACLANANNPTGQARDGGRPEWHQMSRRWMRARSEQGFVKGTTYWVNDYMAIGHVMFDTQLLSVLTVPDLEVDKVILQRAPCVTHDLCNKNGNKSVYESFFLGHYGTLLDVADSVSKRGKTPANIYIRFMGKEPYWKPRPVRSEQALLRNTSYIDAVLPHTPYIRVQRVVCFERVLRRTTNRGFFYSLSVPMVRKFKQFAVQQASDGKTNSQWNLPSRGPSRELCVTVVGREEIHARHMSNEEYLIQLLNRTLEGNTGDRMLTVRRFNSGSVQLTHSDQVMVSATSDILVATHGAFETNVMYMPEGALLLEIRGEDGQFEREGDNFRGLAHTYMVHYRSVRARGLLSLRQKKYDLKRGEMQEIADIALDYVKYKVGS